MNKQSDFTIGSKISYRRKIGTVISNTYKDKNTLAIEYDDGSIGEALINKQDFRLIEIYNPNKKHIEKQFVNLYNNFKNTFRNKFIEINKIKTEMVHLAEEYGIPFGNENETYIPESMKEKFTELSLSDIENLIDINIWKYSYGWQNSSLSY